MKKSAGKPPATHPLSLLAGALLLAGTIAGVFLCGGPEQGAMGVYLAAAGTALILCPPRTRVDWRLWGAAAGLIFCCSLAFLPAQWLPTPPWRAALASSPAIALPATISVEPRQTAFWLALLVLSTLIGLFLLAHPLRSNWLIRFALAAVLACGAYAALAVYCARGGWRYPFAGGADFGFFPNRNHTATFLVTGGVLSAGVIVGALRGHRWWVAVPAAVALSVCATALFFFSGSRAGIVFGLLGMLLWMAGLGGKYRDIRLLVSFAALLVAGGLLFAVSGSEVRNRLVASLLHPRQAVAPRYPGLTPDKAEPEPVPFDFRMLIYRDTLDLIKDHPVAGTGLGTFGCVFPQYRNASIFDATALHPESDWLMLVAEAGFPALGCGLLLLALLAGRLRYSRQTTSWPLRWGLAAAAGTALLHGLVDVPAHRVELGWWILLLAGWGLQPGSGRDSGCSRVQHVLFVVGGFAALAFGVVLIRAQWFGGSYLPPFAEEKARMEIFKAHERKDSAGALKQVRQALLASPMSEALYFQRGILLAESETQDKESSEDFKVQRLLSPFLPGISLRQGDVWSNDDPAFAENCWADAFIRRKRMNRVLGAPFSADLAFYRDLVKRAAGKSELQRSLLGLAQKDPSMVLAWLESVPPGLRGDPIGRFTREEHFLGMLDEGERGRLLSLWYADGDREALWRFLEGHGDWSAAAWPVKTRRLADEQKFEQATRETAAHYNVSLTLPEPRPGTSAAVAAGLETSDPAAAFLDYWRAGNTLAARRVLTGASPDAGGTNSSEIWRLRAALAAHDARWPAAWGAMDQYARSRDQSGAP